jgi:hypothetical protein
MIARLQTWLGRPSIGWKCALLAVALSLPAVGSHRVFDDFVLALGARASHDPALAARRFGTLDLFTFTNGVPAENMRLTDLGSMLPWWSDPHLKVAFFRPLSALTHLLDQVLCPDWVWLQYLHSLLWLGLLVAVVARLYRALGGSPAIAGLAALMYAIDDAHGPAVAWLCNRNGLVAAVFGTLALLAHHAWRSQGRRWPAALAAGSLLAGLLAGESALATCAYLFAYAVVLEPGTFRRTLRRRAASLLPYAGVTAAWAVAYKLAGYGASHSGVYVDPIADAGRFVRNLPAHATALLGAVFGPIPADIVLFDAGAERRGLIAAAITLVLLGCVLVPTVRRDRQARFWALGMLLATVPASACYPTDRLLLFVGMGAMALVARIVASAVDQTQRLTRLSYVLALAFGFVHLVLAPLLLPVRAAQMRLVARAIESATETLDRAQDLEHRTVIVVNPPIDPFVSYIQAERALRSLPRPLHLYWLASAIAPIQVTRLGPRTLAVEREGGLMTVPIERLYRSSSVDLPAGSEVLLSEMRAEIASTTADGRPREVRFHFADDLESHRYLFLAWDEGRLLPFELPVQSQTVHFPAQNIAHIVLHSLGRRTP